MQWLVGCYLMVWWVCMWSAGTDVENDSPRSIGAYFNADMVIVRVMIGMQRLQRGWLSEHSVIDQLFDDSEENQQNTLTIRQRCGAVYTARVHIQHCKPSEIPS